MWYKQARKNTEVTESIDYTYLNMLFDNPQEAIEFLEVFIQEFTSAKVALHTAIVAQDVEAFRKKHHNIRPHLEMLKITRLGDLLSQAKDKLDNPEPFDDRVLFAATISQSFDQLIQQIQEKLSTVR